MWIERLTSSSTTHAIELTARYAEQRHKVLAENIANIDTPNYHTKRLDPELFQSTLGEAIERSRGNRSRRLELRGNAQVSTTRQGGLQVEPTTRPADNILFHDGRNASLEKLMTDLQANSLDYGLATTLLGRRFEGMMTAIRGRVR